MEKQQDGRIKRLDGIRGLAIVLVFLIHARISRFGWVGVPMFFALSGYLITGILRRAREDRSFWAPFYIKRATRILPPLLILFLIAALFCDVAWRQVGLYLAFFAANIAETIHRGKTGPLSVLWSLAVEEQFYLLWPFAIRYLSRRALMIFLTAALLLEPCLRGFFTPYFSTMFPIFYLTPFQLDGLAAGSLLALLLENSATKVALKYWSGRSLAISLLALVMLSFYPAFDRDQNSVIFNSFGYTIVYLASASLVGFVLLNPESRLSSVFGSRPAVFLGAISYGFYLFHLAGITFTDQIAHAIQYRHLRTLSPLTFAAVTIFSWLSFRFYEQPIIAWGKNLALRSNRSGSSFRQSASVSSSGISLSASGHETEIKSAGTLPEQAML
ncbi:acyltransferase family protein [Silvibacterium acidisoli]|uniref:acyltransferase family protein n=1 Tax=Acidobacteriaceae bacterium ZG23-2 TaxID=2883246 RepID=UPI00406D169D